MCTLAIYFQVGQQFPLVIAANRDEFYDRPATGPERIAADPWIVAGRDLRAGGTWLGINAHHVVAGLLNRRSATPPDPARRSRGVLCVESLRHVTVAAASADVCREPGDRYNPFSLLLASPAAACVIGNHGGRMAMTPLSPGLHLLTNLDIDDLQCPRIAASYHLFDAARHHVEAGAIDCLLPVLRDILSGHSTPLAPRAAGPPTNLCVHSERFGTRSSSLIVYSRAARRCRLWHADGPPCRTTYTEVPLPEA